MIWAPVSFRSCFCWLYRTSPSSAAKNTIWFWYWPLVMSMFRVVSCVVGVRFLLWPGGSFGKTLLAFPCFILYSKAKLSCYSRYLLTFFFCISVPCDEKDLQDLLEQTKRRCLSSYRIGIQKYDPTDIGNLSLVPLPFQNSLWTSGNSQFTYHWSLT